MGKDFNVENTVLLLDTYNQDSKKLHKSFQLVGKNYPVFVLEDNGFLPEGVTSVYDYFLGDFKNATNISGRPRYFNQIQVPKYWQITGSNSSGKIFDKNKEKGHIFYAEPSHKRLVKIVDWLDDRGVVRSSDHYNKYGALYARTIFNKNGQKVNRSYFSVDGKEVIVENFVTKDIILNDGNTVRIFLTKKEFVLFCLERAGYAQYRFFYNTLSTSFLVSHHLKRHQKEDILFWQEPIADEIPGNMRLILDGNSMHTKKIMVQRKDAYQKMLQLGVSQEKIQYLGFMYPFHKQNEGSAKVLICTNSDNIEQCEHLITALPQLHFYIVALTEMSSKLMNLDKYENVSLYPGVKMAVLEELFETCDYYLDINHQSEIVSAVEKAFLHNHLIFAFEETVHNLTYIAPEYIYKALEVEKMIQCLKDTLTSDMMRMEHLKKQQTWGGLEDKEAYLKL